MVWQTNFQEFWFPGQKFSPDQNFCDRSSCCVQCSQLYSGHIFQEFWNSDQAFCQTKISVTGHIVIKWITTSLMWLKLYEITLSFPPWREREKPAIISHITMMHSIHRQSVYLLVVMHVSWCVTIPCMQGILCGKHELQLMHTYTSLFIPLVRVIPGATSCLMLFQV